MDTILDMKCAEWGKTIADAVKDESVITKALGVLQENGVYAFFLFLSANKKGYSSIKDKAFEFLKSDGIMKNIIGDANDPLKAAREALAKDIHALLFAKEMIERALVYARYHAKATGESA